MSRRRGHKRPVNEIVLKPEDVQQLNQQQQIIQQQQHILNSLQQAFVRFIEDSYHINLRTEAWELDMEKGTLTRHGPRTD